MCNPHLFCYPSNIKTAGGFIQEEQNVEEYSFEQHKFTFITSKMLRFIRKVALSSLKTNSWKIPLCTKALACTHFASSTVTLIPLLLTKHVADCSTIQKKNWKQVFCNRLSYNLLFIAAAIFLFNYWVVIRENENRFSGSKENHAFYNK